MHETLEMKEEEIAQLRAHIKQVLTQSEELKEQKEKSEKAGKKLCQLSLVCVGTGFCFFALLVCTVISHFNNPISFTCHIHHN